MTSHQLHTTARALALRLGITHGEACSMLAKRRRSKHRLGPRKNFSATAKTATYWWQND